VKISRDSIAALTFVPLVFALAPLNSGLPFNLRFHFFIKLTENLLLEIDTMERVLPERLIFPWLVKKFAAFYGRGMYGTLFMSAWHLPLSLP
jgi:hypothetical protein